MAQVGRGAISGTVTDANGAVVPEAAITITNPQTGYAQQTTTSGVGTFFQTSMPVGEYVVTVSKPGFATERIGAVAVSVATTVRLDVQLRVGQLEQVMDVTSAAPIVVADRTDLGTVMSTQEILDLPLSLSGGLRDNLSFTVLTPGVVLTPGNNNSLRIGGGLGMGHSMILDGGEAMSERRNDSGFQAVSTDAISQFKVISNSFSAEYGRMSNGVIDFITKSGTNDLHGSAFEYFRNTVLNARKFFSADRAVVRQNNFGGTIGGPVRLPGVYDGRNRAFFFFSYEKAIYRAGNPSSIISIPSLAMRQGDFRGFTDSSGRTIPIYDPATSRVVNGQVVRDQFPGNMIPSSRISTVASTINRYLPAPDLPGAVSNYYAVGNPGNNQDVWSIKGDYNLTPNSRLSGLFSRQYSGSPDQIGAYDGPLGYNVNSSGRSRFYRLSHDQVLSPTLVNHIAFGYNDRVVSEYYPQRYYNIPESDRALIQIKGAYFESPSDNIVPPSQYDLGDQYRSVGRYTNTYSPSRTAQITEHLSWVKSNHNLKFGFQFLRADYRRINCLYCTGRASFSNNTTGLPGSSATTGSGYASFLLGQASNVQYNQPGDFSFGQPYYAWFLQDDWKVNRRLTLNLGLRYELPFSKTESQSRVSNLCLTCPNPAAGGIPGALQFAGEGAGRTGESSFLDTRYQSWGPRIGLAYQPVDSLVIRTAGGVFYVPVREGGNADNATTGFQGMVIQTSPDGGYTPAWDVRNQLPGAGPVPNLDPGQQLFGTVFFAPRYAGLTPKMYNWNFTIEKGFGQNSVFRVSYSGLAGVSLLSQRELLNQADPAYLSLGSLLSAPISSAAAQQAGIRKPWSTFPDDRSVAQALRPYPQYTSFKRDVDSDTAGHSTYHAMGVSFEHRYRYGLWLQASYTWSKLIANVEGENTSNGGNVATGQDVGTQNAWDRSADKAVSQEDVPHHLVLAWSWELPFGRGRKFLGSPSGLAQAVFGGWKISAVQQYQSGFPLSVTSNLNTGLYSGQERANIVSGVPLRNPAWNGDPAVPYINPAAFQRPAPYTFGNSPKTIAQLRTPAMLNEDVTLTKDFPLFREGQRLSFAASAFNIANRVQFGGITTGVESSAFGRATSQYNNSREIQLNIRLVF